VVAQVSSRPSSAHTFKTRFGKPSVFVQRANPKRVMPIYNGRAVIVRPRYGPYARVRGHMAGSIKQQPDKNGEGGNHRVFGMRRAAASLPIGFARSAGRYLDQHRPEACQVPPVDRCANAVAAVKRRFSELFR
jgi:hypothetical protein